MRTRAFIFLTLASLLGAFAEQCGKQAGGALCPKGFCCSEYGWCGVTAAHCTKGCQSQCIQMRCGKQGRGAICPGGLCCSQYGYCGLTDAYCGKGCQSQCQERCGKQAEGALCTGGRCCSQHGYCGTTDAYCGEGCQSQCFTEQCGKQAGGALCPGGLCCSEYGWCGSTDAYCGKGCQSQCSKPRTPVPPTIQTLPTPPGSGGDLSSLIPQSLFEEMLKHRNDVRCPANGFYTYDAFISAASAFPDFATVGDTVTRKREIAAFLAQTSHETTGGWDSAPGGPYAWGYCFVREIGEPGGSCVPNGQWPCVPGQSYYGRGPIQLSYNYNYGPAGEALGYDVLSNPDLVATDSVISFKTAFWFWMTPQSPKPSCHEVITCGWTPSPSDTAAGRVPGFGVITNIINGGLECGHGPNDRVENRIGFYKRYCDLLGIGYGENLDCNNQRPFGNAMEYYSSMK